MFIRIESIELVREVIRMNVEGRRGKPKKEMFGYD